MAKELIYLLDEGRLVILCEYLLHLVLFVPPRLDLAFELLDLAPHLLLLSHRLLIK